MPYVAVTIHMYVLCPSSRVLVAQVPHSLLLLIGPNRGGGHKPGVKDVDTGQLEVPGKYRGNRAPF